MPPKKSTSAASKKAPAVAPGHASYEAMITDAIIALKERSGSSRQAIKKYVRANNKLNVTDAAFNSHINRALNSGVEKNVFDQPKGPSGPVKLKKNETKASPPAAKKETPKKEASTTATKKTTAKAEKAPAKKAAPKKAAPKKAADTKKAAPKKATETKKAAPKKTATKKAAPAKPKANAGRPRKAAPAAPAVEDKPATVLGKTKSGRVTKTTAPVSAAKPAAKRAATTKTAAGKKGTPKKATPKKAAA